VCTLHPPETTNTTFIIGTIDHFSFFWFLLIQIQLTVALTITMIKTLVKSLLFLSFASKNVVVDAACPSAAAGYVKKCSENVFESSDISIDCSNEDEYVTYSGTITLKNDLEDEGTVTGIPCLFWRMYCFKNYAEEIGNFCELAEHKDGEKCGTSGVYNIEGDFYVPEKARSFMMASIKLVMDFDESCKKVKNDDYAFLVGISAVPMVGLVAYMVHRSKKRSVVNMEGANEPMMEMKSITTNLA